MLFAYLPAAGREERTTIILPDSVALLKEGGQREWCIAAKTNLLYDAAVVPTLGVEVALGRAWSAGAEGSYIWIRNYRRDRHWRIEGGNVYVRRWLGDRSRHGLLSGHHIGLYGMLCNFQIQTCESHGFISGRPGTELGYRPGWGVGVEYGFSLPLSKRLSMDFGLGIGYFHAGINRYGRPQEDCTACGGSHGYVLQKREHLNWIGPTKAEVSLVWRFGPIHGGTPKTQVP